MKWDPRRWMPWGTLITDVLLINVAFLIASGFSGGQKTFGDSGNSSAVLRKTMPGRPAARAATLDGATP